MSVLCPFFCVFVLCFGYLPVSIAVRPDSLLLSGLETFDSLRPGDLKIGPSRGHQVVVSSGPNNMGIRAIGFLKRI